MPLTDGQKKAIAVVVALVVGYYAYTMFFESDESKASTNAQQAAVHAKKAKQHAVVAHQHMKRAQAKKGGGQQQPMMKATVMPGVKPAMRRPASTASTSESFCW